MCADAHLVATVVPRWRQPWKVHALGRLSGIARCRKVGLTGPLTSAPFKLYFSVGSDNFLALLVLDRASALGLKWLLVSTVIQ